ncbi:transcriptional regulator [Methylobacterium sp. J-077]|uniref:transcriptional regulator n=1 Tax=Methylobacterium sp. J-077 TaxID=2836656 RepID=UPI001FBB3958|nr:transcriptional regulator [Methylobacterium sp. J-077]MCJ2124774.1 transcriptional regulator [Methylobacterium sp. J-077]
MVNWRSGDILTITGGQLRAARAFLRWTAQEVADASRVGVATVRRAELQDGPLGITAANAEAIKRALEAAGVEFINGGEPGVKLRRKDPA